MAGLPKKYAKMGFAKGWRAFKRSKSKRRSTRSKPQKRRSSNMARRRRRSAPRRMGKRGSKKLLGNKAVQSALGGGLYGLAREPVNQFVKGLLPNQLGNVADEVVLLAASAAAAAKGKGLVKQAGYAGLAIEAHNLARNFNLGSFGSNSQSTSVSSQTI